MIEAAPVFPAAGRIEELLTGRSGIVGECRSPDAVVPLRRDQ
jgi:hypothetical protein